MRRWLAIAMSGAVLSLAAAATPLRAAHPVAWKQVITATDRARLAGLWRAWTTARTQVFAGGQGAAWLNLAALTDPVAATADGPPPPGRYTCRSVKLGTRNAGMPVWTMAGTTACRVDAVRGTLRFVRDDGGQRSSGVLYADGDRLVYLGALSLASEAGLFRYNADPDRNQVGVLTAIGPRRWRLELPWPRWESTLDLVEIVPAT